MQGRQTQGAPRVRPREVLRDREFRALLLSSSLSLAGDQVARIAVAYLVYDRTHSTLAVTATLAVSYLTWVLGGPVLAGLADRLPRRALMLACDVARAALIGLLVLPGVPLPAVFAVLVLVGALSPPFDGARSALLPEVLRGDRYVVGSALQNSVLQGGQLVGLLLAGAAVAVLGVRGALAVDAVTYAVSAALLAAFVRERPLPARPAPGSPSAGTWAGARLVAGDRELRRLLTLGLLAALVVIAPEGLAVPVADGLGRGATSAGLLLAVVPAGFLAGSALLVRLEPARRLALLPGLVVVAGVALALTPVAPGAAGVAVLWAVAGAGGALSTVANTAYTQAVPPELRGRAYGVAATALMAGQGLVLLLLGALGDRVDAGIGVAAAGACAVAGGLLLAARTPLSSPDALQPDPA